ncbi:unnamed protein product [Microthlaspi erraticum]|uniref:Uncharacterized protein n=1 Tax=Microthlaspi erraticum TaxID=1685480 RepID=A0A6D2HWV1_9BRAS|nr:unnamed protein product [Microthlaspi erraticum]
MVLMRGGLSNRNVPHQGLTDTPPVLRGQEANAEEGDQHVADQTMNKEHASENIVAQAPESNHTDAATILPDSQTAETPNSNTKKKRKRGPTRMRKVAKDPEDRVKVLFSQFYIIGGIKWILKRRIHYGRIYMRGLICNINGKKMRFSDKWVVCGGLGSLDL